MAQAAQDVFTEVVVAPGFDDDALELLRRKKNRRLLQLPADLERFRDPIETRAISGGLLVQSVDRVDAVTEDGGDDPTRWRLVSGAPADEATLADLAFAWRSVRAVKSNAILLAHDGAAVGVGMGQVNRVDSCRLAVSRAGEEGPGAPSRPRTPSSPSPTASRSSSTGGAGRRGPGRLDPRRRGRPRRRPRPG